MKHSTNVIALVPALAVTPPIMLEASAQTQPTNEGTPPAAAPKLRNRCKPSNSRTSTLRPKVRHPVLQSEPLVGIHCRECRHRRWPFPPPGEKG